MSSAASTGTGAEKKALTDHIQKMGGLMTPEHVAEGFYRLLTQCSNGATMIVVKDSPYIVLPDTSLPTVLSVVAVARLLEKVLAPQVVRGQHLLVAFAAIFLLFCFLLTVIF